MVTIKQIAKAVGVSPSTASIVLRGDAVRRKVAADTAERVLQCARELGYQPDLSARRLRGSGNAPIVLGVYWSSEFKANMMQAIYGIQEEILRQDRNIETVIHQYQKGKLEQAMHTFRSCHAAIICNALPEDIQAVRSSGCPIPVIFYSRDLPDFTCVQQNLHDVGLVPAKIFAEHQRKHALLLIPEARFQGWELCANAFIHYAMAHGMSVRQIVTPHSMQGGYDAGKQIMELTPCPDCIFSFSDVMSFGLVKYLHDCHANIPAEMDLISMGNYDREMESFAAIPLSVMEVPMEEMACECVRQALYTLDHPTEPVRKVVVATPYVARETCGE
jgi:LacI family transcriptional regulator